MDKLYLTSSERDCILATLTEEQRAFLRDHVRRGIANVFTRELAVAEGIHVRDDMSTAEVARQLQAWEFYDYQDAGPHWQRISTLRCECGKQLRYQLSVRNKQTGVILRFGETHFAEHMQLPPRVVQAIKSGITDAVDYELDQLLKKIETKWKLPFTIPDEFELPKDIEAHLTLGLPLLERQMTRLWQLLPKQQPTASRAHAGLNPNESSQRNQSATMLEIKPRAPRLTVLPDHLKPMVVRYVDNGMTSARQLANRLVTEGLVPDNKSATGLPDIYIPMVIFFRGNPEYQVTPIGKEDCRIQRRV